MASSAVYVVLMAALALAIQGHPSADGTETVGRYMSQRCIEMTRTPVSCDLPGGANATLLMHPDDCGLFYYCVGAEQPAVCLECPAGLHFNRRESVCDYPEHAGCQ